MKRACGVLLPVFSLPGNYGIGSFSVKAYKFVDTLMKSKQTYWQILPLGPTGFGDSPYQSFSSFAGNPYLIDLDELVTRGLLNEHELKEMDWGSDQRYVDYGKQWENKEKMLLKAFRTFKESLKHPERFPQPVQDRLDRNRYEEKLASLAEGTKEYCLYRAIKNSMGGKSWTEWDEPLRLRDPAAIQRFEQEHAEEIEFHQWVQIVFRDKNKFVLHFPEPLAESILYLFHTAFQHLRQLAPFSEETAEHSAHVPAAEHAAAHVARGSCLAHPLIGHDPGLRDSILLPAVRMPEKIPAPLPVGGGGKALALAYGNDLLLCFLLGIVRVLFF